MFIQNLKVAFRNLMKYKVQTLLSIASIAIGIVTLSLAFSVMTRFSLPSILSQPFKDRAYEVIFNEIDGRDSVSISSEAVRALKQDGGLRHAEQIALLSKHPLVQNVEFHLMDSTKRKGDILAIPLDPEFAIFAGLRSTISGEKIPRLKKGEAIITEKYAKELFQDANPIGATQKISDTYRLRAYPFTIVDIYKETSIYDPLPNHAIDCILYSDEEGIVEGNISGFFPDQVYLVLKDGSSVKDLNDELNLLFKPFNLEARLSKVINSKEIRKLIAIHILVYATGSLLLLAAIIGFLRMQIQFFWMRRREISLRIVNGARRLQIFWLLFLEVSVIILLSIGLSILLGYLLEDFLKMDAGIFDNFQLTIKNLWLYSVEIGILLILICSLIAWTIIRRIGNEKHALSKNMYRGRNHLFRNSMIGVQIAICIIFVALTFILINGGYKLLASYNTPENDTEYREYIFIDEQYNFKQWNRLVEDVENLSDLDKMISCTITYVCIEGFQKHLWGNYYTHMPELFYFVDDSSALSTLGIEVDWSNQDINRNNCILIGEDCLPELQEKGLLENNTLTYESSQRGIVEKICQPIGGIIKKMPYRDNTKLYMVINPPADKFKSGYILVPKRGRGKALARSVREAIESIEPGRIEIDGNGGRVMQNYRSFVTSNPDTVEAVTTLGWILGIVSVVICAMSILSTITLDTRSRRKEVAIRKVNGAKSIDIYRLFGRVYIVLLAFAIIVAIPVCVMFNGFVENYVKDHSTVEGFSPLWPIIMAISIVTILILAIVGWQTRKTLHMDPAKIIAKE